MVNSQAFILFGVESSLYVCPVSYISTQSPELHENSSCKTILKFVPIETNDYLKKIHKKKTMKIQPLQVVNLELLLEVTTPGSAESVYVLFDKKPQIHFKMTLPIDVVIFANPDDPWGRLLDQVIESISSQLSEMEKCVQRYTKGQTVPIPQPFHFELPGKPTLTTVMYPAGITDEELEPQRKEMHKEFGLDNKPYLRRTMAYTFPSDELMNKYLKNIHQYISLPDTEEFKVHLVHGSYTYHHYLQDGVNDIGWGCAYRALQTIVSWYNFQGYTSINIPTHEEIQKRLVKAGDKSPDFVGSTDWIGSFEIQTVLNTMDITSKILSLQQSSDFLTSARELSEHFDMQGSPIMVGSETLAHVLLGIAWNETTGAVRFLVLDTHYTGEDEWASAVEKGIDWKTEEFWISEGPHNLCMPQRPGGV
ncbi:ufm1-specific protease 2 isoform X2 [Narcine bancroftii]